MNDISLKIESKLNNYTSLLDFSKISKSIEEEKFLELVEKVYLKNGMDDFLRKTFIEGDCFRKDFYEFLIYSERIIYCGYLFEVELGTDYKVVVSDEFVNKILGSCRFSDFTNVSYLYRGLTVDILLEHFICEDNFKSGERFVLDFDFLEVFFDFISERYFKEK